MSNLEPRTSRRVSRKDREARAFRLAVAGAGFGAVASIGMVLAIVGVVGFGIPLLSGIVAVICFVLFKRSVGI